MASIYDFTARDIDGAERSLGDYRGKLLLIVNTASQCGFNGPKAHPLYDYLTRHKGGGLLGRGIKWNFTKFLIGRDGKVLARFAPTVKPEALDKVIARRL